MVMLFPSQRRGLPCAVDLQESFGTDDAYNLVNRKHLGLCTGGDSPSHQDLMKRFFCRSVQAILGRAYSILRVVHVAKVMRHCSTYHISENMGSRRPDYLKTA